MARYYEDESGTVVYELEPFDDDNLMKGLFRKCWEVSGKGFYFRGAHGGKPTSVVKPLFAYWDKLYALQYDGGLEFAMTDGLDDAYFECLLMIWDVYDQNCIWFFAEPPKELPTELPQPETARLPPHIRIFRTNYGDILITATGAMKIQKKMIIRNLGLQNRDTAV